MQYTNKNNLSELMVKAVSKDWHDLEDAKYSITQLIKPPRILQLERRHREEMTLEVSDFWNTFIGTAIHGGIAASIKDDKRYVIEKRQVAEVNGIKISGTPDVVDTVDGIIYDHKTMTTAAFGLEVKPEYEAQLNIYAYMLRKNGFTINGLKLNCIYLDWRKAACKHADPTKYPQTPCRIIEVPLWTDAKTEKFLLERLALHEAACSVEDDSLPDCASDETWERPGKIAVYPKGGAVRAMKLCNTEQEVTDWLSYKKMSRGNIMLDYRPATRMRCEQYCSAAPFCSQYKAWLDKQASKVAASEEEKVA